MSNQYGWKFILDNTTDITDKIRSFTIDSSLDSYCRELSFDLLDDQFFDTLDFSIIPDAPRIEVFTRITEVDEEDEYDDAWESQGLFFIERPTFQVGVNETTTGVWGRQSTAVLGEPFAQKITKLWDINTTFYAICQEIIESVGLVWDSTKCDIQDYNIYSDNFEADDDYPIEALRSLVTLIVGEEGFITSDRLGNVWIRRLDRDPETSDHDITDLVVQSINEEPEWPEFGNRIKIIPSETLSQDTITIYMENQCIGTGSASYLDVYAQVKDGNGVPINDSVVSWTFDPLTPLYLWFKYPEQGKTCYQNSSILLVSNEVVRATGFNSLALAFEPDTVIGIWAYADKNRVSNFIDDGYVIDGNNVYLTGNSFSFCDQQVYVSYYASGMVKNTIVYDTTISDPSGIVNYGSTSVVASISGREDTMELHVNNSCKCKSSLTVKVLPTTIVVGVENAKIEAYLENSGVPVTGTIRMSEIGGFGSLQWASRVTSTSETSENTDAINVVSGVSQCVVSSAISTVTGVWVIVRDPVTEEDVKTGANLYSSFYGRTIDLTTILLTGTTLLVEYSRAGSVTNFLSGIRAGVSRIDVSSDVSTEEGLTQTVQVTVQAAPTVPSGGSTGGGTTPPPAVTYYAQGPSFLKWMFPYDWTYGPWYIKGSNGVYIATTSMRVVGAGFLRVANINYLTIGPKSFGQTVTITVYGNVPGVGQVSGTMQVTLSY